MKNLNLPILIPFWKALVHFSPTTQQPTDCDICFEPIWGNQKCSLSMHVSIMCFENSLGNGTMLFMYFELDLTIPLGRQEIKKIKFSITCWKGQSPQYLQWFARSCPLSAVLSPGRLSKKIIRYCVTIRNMFWRLERLNKSSQKGSVF